MTTHALVFTGESATDAMFVCTICGEVIGFNKARIGEPHASLVDGAWIPPGNYDDWMNSSCL